MGCPLVDLCLVDIFHMDTILCLAAFCHIHTYHTSISMHTRVCICVCAAFCDLYMHQLKYASVCARVRVCRKRTPGFQHCWRMHWLARHHTARAQAKDLSGCTPPAQHASGKREREREREDLSRRDTERGKREAQGQE